jgi:hypothetical protein
VNSTTPFPSLEDVSKEWLSELLRNGGHPDAKVLEFDTATVGTGQVAKCVRFDMEVESSDPAVPKTLIGKFSSDNPASRKTASEISLYRKEVIFYREFQPGLSISTPKCYFADIADNNSDFALVMSDMYPAVQGNQLEGCSVELLRKAVNELVGLHAPTWCRQDLLSNPLTASSQAKLDGDKKRYANCVEPFLDRFGPTLSKGQVDIIRQLGTSTKPLFTSVQPIHALVHGDYRLDNMLISPHDDPTLTVVDWQTIKSGNPLADVAYVIASSLTPEVRKSVERDLVEDYHRRLTAAGIGNYSWEDCWNDYRRGSLSGFTIMVVAAVSVKRTDRGDTMFQLMIDRFSRQALELEADELIA